jgi:hypothetical protein
MWQDRYLTVDFIGLTINIGKTKNKCGKEMLFSDLVSVAETSQDDINSTRPPIGSKYGLKLETI